MLMALQSENYQPGSRVRVMNIPDWLLLDLPVDEQSRLLDQMGRVVEVLEVLPNGYLWLSFSDGTAGFSVQTADVTLAAESNK